MDSGTLAQGTFDMDGTPYSIDDRIDDGQAQPRTFVNAAFLGRKERFKYLGKMVRRDPHPLIGHINAYRAAGIIMERL